MEQTANNEERLFLEEVTLSGYKSIYNTSITFKKGINIIIGKNAVGKTNFLSFLFKVLSFSYDNLFDFKSDLIFKNGKRLNLYADNYLDPDIVKNNGAVSLIGTRTHLSINGQFVLTDFNTKEVYLKLFENKVWFNPTFIKHGISSAFFLDRPFSISDKPFTIEVNKLGTDFSLFNYITDIDTPSFVRYVLSFFLRASSQPEEMNVELIRQKTQKAFEQINLLLPHLKKVSPIKDIRLNPNFTVALNNNNDTYLIDNLFYEFFVEGNWYSFPSLSDGVKRLFHIIAEIAFTGQSYFSKFGILHSAEISYSRIILIEEPELGIHPHQLNELMLFLKAQSKKMQIIITTHSPQVIDILNKDELGSVIIASYEKEKGTVLRHLNEQEIAKASRYMDAEYLSDYWRFSDLEKQE